MRRGRRRGPEAKEEEEKDLFLFFPGNEEAA